MEITGNCMLSALHWNSFLGVRAPLDTWGPDKFYVVLPGLIKSISILFGIMLHKMGDMGMGRVVGDYKNHELVGLATQYASWHNHPNLHIKLKEHFVVTA